jgi:hypothetical protein
LLERANLLLKALEQICGSSDDKRSSSTNILENVSSSSIHIDQDQEEQLSVQKEKVKFVSLEKPDCLISQTGVSGFDRTKTFLIEEEDCSTSSSDDDDDDDDEYDYEELLLEFKKLISKHMKLQKRHVDLLCSHKEVINSYTLLESTHEVIVTKVKDSQSHSCICAPPSINLSYDNSCCFQAKSSCDKHVLIETYDSFIASKNNELKSENKMLKIKLSRLKDKGHMQPSQDNHNHMVKKLEKRSTVTCVKLPRINLKTSYQKFDKPKIKKKAHVKRFECSTLEHFSSKCPNKKNDRVKLSRRQRSLSQRICYGCKEKGHIITDCSKEEVSK